MEKAVLKVRMLGDFSMEYQGKAVVLERSQTTKTSQLLQFFLYHHEETLSREHLEEVLYDGKDIVSPANNLKVNMYRLRRQLTEALPSEGRYISFKKGEYRWSSEIPTEVDVHVFERMALRARQLGEVSAENHEERLELLRQAAGLYQGELLPQLATIPWVIFEGTRLQKLYTEVIIDLFSLSDPQGEENLEDLYRQAVSIYPFQEEFYYVLLQFLVTKKRYTEALELYTEMSSLFFRELGVLPTPKMEKLYRRICVETDNSATSLSEIKAILREDEGAQGAYFCNYRTFIDSYRIVSRMVERNGQSVFLMLCTMTDSHGELLAEEKLPAASGLLRNAIQKSIRRGDIYTQYNRSQHLVMLVGINQENCALVEQRMRKLFAAEPGSRGIRLRQSIQLAADFDPENPGNRFFSPELTDQADMTSEKENREINE